METALQANRPAVHVVALEWPPKVDSSRVEMGIDLIAEQMGAIAGGPATAKGAPTEPVGHGGGDTPSQAGVRWNAVVGRQPQEPADGFVHHIGEQGRRQAALRADAERLAGEIGDRYMTWQDHGPSFSAWDGAIVAERCGGVKKPGRGLCRAQVLVLSST